jgi:uncharacterized iron-regulated membrane protein
VTSDRVPISPGRRKGRNLWLKIHLYIGLVLGLELSLVGLTGSLLVFHKTIDMWLNPALLTTNQRGARTSIDDIFAVARAAVPQAVGPDTSVSVQMPLCTDGTYLAWVKIPGVTAEDARWHQVSLDPYTGAVRGIREEGTSLISLLYSLHYTLLLGAWGETVVGVSGLLLLLSVSSGVYLWWPRRGKLKQALTINFRAGRTRLNFDAHRVSGLYVGLVPLVVSFSGISMIFPRYVQGVVRIFLPVSDAPITLKSVPQPGGAPIAPSRAITAAAGVFPDADLTSIIDLPSMGPEGAYVVRMRQPGEVRKSGGATVVWVDQYRGDILHIRNPRTMNAGDAFLLWQFPLHNGEAFGLLGRLVILLSGLSLPLLYVTGLFIWWRKRRAHRRAQRIKQRG